MLDMNKCAESKNNIVPCAAAKTFEIIMFLKMAYFVKQYHILNQIAF